MNWQGSFDDLREGDAFSTPSRAVTEADVVGFAALTGDWHPQHTDARWAAAGPFGERIAHGMLVVSLAVGSVPFDPRRVVALRRVSDLVFKRPVRLGDPIRVEGAIAELRPVDESTGLVSWRWRIVGGRGELVCRATVEALWRRGPLPEEPGTFVSTPDGHVLIPL